MLKSALAFWAAVGAVLLGPAPALGQPSPDWARCINEGSKFPPDAIFTGCSNVIHSGRESKLNLAVAYGKRGNAYQDKGEYDSAIADYTKAIEINTRDAVAYNNRGIAYRAKGDNDRAIADYTKAIEINEDDAVAYNNRGIAYRAKGEYESSIADHDKAIEIDPELASAYNNRGIAYRAKGDNDRAIEDATMAIEIDPEFASAYYNRGNAYRAKGDNDRAISEYTKAIQINPRHAGAYHNRAIAYRANGDEDRAIADHTKATEINPKYADAAPVSTAEAPLSTASIEKTDLTPREARSPLFTLVLKADLGTQQVSVWENDAIVHVWPISSGVQGYATPTGIFRPQWASRMWYSRQYNWTPMPYAVFFTRGVAFHGTNVTSRLGKSASHGCVRLATSNAAKLFNLVHKHGFAQTQIIVYGTPKHDAPAVARRVPTVGPQTTTSSGLPSWAKALFNQ